MTIVVDTPVWSLAYRRRTVTAPQAIQLANLINREEAVIIGAIRQEVLSGIRDRQQFALIRERMRAFPDWPVYQEHYERAAEFFTLCKARGLQGSNTDFLICAAASLYQLPIFTVDQDFEHFAAVLPIELFKP